jgi:D-alanine-D-alanine ligase
VKIALVRHTPGARVLRRRGRQNREFYKESDIAAARDALAELGHEVETFEGDATLPDALRARYGDADGHVADDLFVWNMAYGVQGECRYTHIPSMLEMLGVPYLASDPRGHTVALDKYLTKILLDRAGLPTPAFGLLRAPGGNEPGRRDRESFVRSTRRAVPAKGACHLFRDPGTLIQIRFGSRSRRNAQCAFFS